MPDEVTRDLAKRMHYAAWRAASAPEGPKRSFWRSAYLSMRDRIVLGNRKLIYRAVRRWSPDPMRADDMAGDCHLVLIQAVAAYNPWIGVRFSTYAFTCLMRALSRMSKKRAADRLARWLPLDSLPDGGPRASVDPEPPGLLPEVDALLRDGHTLLSQREKRVLARRFRLDESHGGGTLEQVGKEMGLSKERVRQMQATALGKIREALRGA
jgi:RNA polymerase primary sigma factor/RNA polymerase sigma factor